MVGLMGPLQCHLRTYQGRGPPFSEALRAAELVATNIGLTTVFPGAHRTGITEGAQKPKAEPLADTGRSRFASSNAVTDQARPPRRGRDREGPCSVIAGSTHALDLWARLAPGRIGPSAT
ncbi:MAG: hypothetical protein R2709_14095 [Marmoricola sp.]